MLDLHALADTTGSVTLVNMSLAANIPANDGQSAAGVPIAPGAILKGYGFLSTIADAVRATRLISQDQIDPINGEYWIADASTLGLVHFDAYLPFQKGLRMLYYRQLTGAAPIIGYTMDKYPTPGGADVKTFGQTIILPQVFAGALTANVWGTQVVAPASNMPAGKYALLGVYVTGLTNYALIRFEHADFGGKKPGFPVVDDSVAVARAVTPMWAPVFSQGAQFLAMGDIPVFNVTANGTGLTIDMLSITAVTPQVMLHVVQLA